MTAFVTFRLADSLPGTVLDAYRSERRRLDRLAIQAPHDPALGRERTRLFCERVDRFLDAGHGSCALAQPDLAEMVMGALGHFDGERYVLHAAVVMPTHVHAVLTLAPQERLERVTHSWKSFTAHEAIGRFGAQSPFWQAESYDHIVRDAFEFDRIVRYVLDNPMKAGLDDLPHVFGRPD